ncbi:hypothetical protein EVJ50_02445 [Synechococcus sp. RSCCF101]|uniref:phenylpyruvate tautomerase MIF-related protein n=1 Tax=Synechococcus sp. RSCCF101 TaxID=2511069 RepID=UPI001244D893|nr:phenylpyruvate tautomerase MIF-related protein [Synechococcus sp. RSCCF101]QEY31274.1 hypothetical protein EVJ50_02445 [Synechococcus sp. RSCCF101]
MPLVRLHTSAPAPTTDVLAALQGALSSSAASLLGKPERYVMTLLETGLTMGFGGDASQPTCYMEVASVGQLKPEQTSRISAAFCALVEQHLGVPADRTYIAFTPAQGHLWGWNGSTFG